MTLEVTDWLREEILRRAEQEDPEECCGMISMGAGDGLALWAAENKADDPSKGFAVDPDDLLAILKQIGIEKHQLVGIYHSHVAGPITPSPEDMENAANWPGLTWVIAGRSVCGACRGEGEIVGARMQRGMGVSGPVGYKVETRQPCDGCDGSGTIPDLWAGRLA